MKPVAYNYKKAEDRIEELTGMVIRLNLENEYLKKKKGWNKDEPESDGIYLVAADVGDDKPYIYSTLRFDNEWIIPDGWKILGWQELPKWEE